MTPLAASLRAFGRETRGTVAVFVALSAATLVTVTGMSVDLVRATFVENELQLAVDAATLAVAREPVPNAYRTDAAIAAYLTPIAQDYFDANFTAGANATTVGPISLTVNTAANTVAVSASASMQTMILQIINKPKVSISVKAGAERAQPGPLELALALDITGSMSGAKLSSLKAAATNLINSLMVHQGVKIGVVPFAEGTGVALSNRDAEWLAVPADSTTTSCSYPNATDCSTATATCMGDNGPYSCSYMKCNILGTPVCTTRAVRWTGCISARPESHRPILDSPASPRYPGMLSNNFSCPTIQPLSNVKSTLLGKISALAVGGNTFLPSGLVWAWNALTPEPPFTEAEAMSSFKLKGGRKAVVFMTDGLNTVSPLNATSPSFSWTYDTTYKTAAYANTLTLQLCANIKSAGIEVYTVLFNVTDVTTKALLRDCASDASKSFVAADSGELAKAFDGIGLQLKQVKLLQ
jgi:Flp pilus assembly protein TadG